MNIANTKKVVKQACIKKVTPMLWGKAGIGKSEVVVSVAKEMAKDKGIEFTTDYDKFDGNHFGLVDLRLGTQEVGDLIGIPTAAERCLENEATFVNFL